MTVSTIFIAIAAAFVGFIIAVFLGVAYVTLSTGHKTNEDVREPVVREPVVREPVVCSKVVMPKRIKEPDYNKRVNAALKEVIDKAVDVWACEDNKPYKRRLSNLLYNEWHAKIKNASYSDYDPKFPCLNFVGRRAWCGFIFENFWSENNPVILEK